MILTGYLDESGTHGDSPITVMGGAMATASKWARFESEFEKIKKRHGFRVFHTKEFKKRSGDFSGWSPERCLRLIDDMSVLTADAFTDSVTFSLDNAAYRSEYLAAERPRTARLDSRYGLCFRECIYFFLRELMRRSRNDKLRKLYVVLESGHKNAGDAERIFHEARRELQARGADLLGTLSFADKHNCNPLMIADFLAHTTYLRERAGRGIQKSGSTSLQSSGIMHLKYEPGGLVGLLDRAMPTRRANR